jgi:hypothetical protein
MLWGFNIRERCIIIKQTVDCKKIKNKKKKAYKIVGFRVLTAVVINTYIFCDTTPCCSLIVNRRSRGTFASISKVEEKAKQEADSKQSLVHAGLLLDLLSDLEDCGEIFLRNVV